MNVYKNCILDWTKDVGNSCWSLNQFCNRRLVLSYKFVIKSKYKLYVMLVCFTKFSSTEEDVDEIVNNTLQKERPDKLIDIESEDNIISKSSPFTQEFKV